MKITTIKKEHFRYCLVKLSTKEQFDLQALEILTTTSLPLLIVPSGVQGWRKHTLQYDTTPYCSLSYFLACAPTNEQLLSVVTQCVSVFEQVNTAQLNTANLLLDLDNVYVNLRSCTVHFVYVPLASSTLQGDAKVFLTALFAKITPSTQLQATLTQFCQTQLQDPAPLDLPLFSWMVSRLGAGLPPLAPHSLRRVSSQENIPLTQSTFLVGLDPDLVHYCIQDNLFISRCHAEFSLHPDGHHLTDLNSRNGTSVNGEALQPNVPKALQSGDEIVLANESFQYI